MSDKLYIRGGLAANRPTLDPRELGLDMDAKKLWVGTSTGNAQAAMATQEAWIVATLINGWVNFGGIQPILSYYKDDMGIVRIKGRIKSGTIGTTVFILPAGYRPIDQATLPILQTNGSAISAGALDIGAGGTAQISPLNPVNDDVIINVSFRT
jgi:hypothetical protein